MSETISQIVKTAAVLETSTPALFRDILKAVAVVNEEPDIILDPEGIKIVSMGPDCVCMVDLLLTRDFFDVYDVVEDHRVALNLKDLNKLVFNRKTGKLKDSSLSIRIEDLKATFKGFGQLKGVKTLNLSEPFEDECPYPKLVHSANVRLVTNTLKRVIDDCTVDPNITITVDDDKVVFRCENDDFLEENTIEKYADDILNFHTEGTQKAIYTVKHLAKFPRALAKISDAVTLEFSTDMPMKISADIPYSYRSHLIYYIAPKIGAPDKTEEPAEVDLPMSTVTVDKDILEEIPEVVPEVEEVLEEILIEVPQVAHAHTLREAQLMFFKDHPEQYSRPTPEQIKPYLYASAGSARAEAP